MITDEVKIKVQAGQGGDGVVAFNKVKMSLGPTGGKGGLGGSVYFQGVSDLTALNKYKRKRDYYAEDGKDGRGDKSTGHGGKDLILTVPIGSVVHNLTTEKDFEITQVGETILAAKGGIGGRGNFYFRSPVNTSPEKYEKGKLGENFEFFIELRLIADVGLVGLPNAGKSSLLNELTRAKARVADYPFTTLEPNLGVMDRLILADIPGLIEGASRGKGLGIKFLKHIQRTKVLVHCLSLESEDLLKDYKIVRQELENYNPELSQKPEIIFLTKSDLFSDEIIKAKMKILGEKNKKIIAISILDERSLVEAKKLIFSLF
ncbi:MAG: GTPase ObgE [Candidatus Moranbacteria bacterium]|nr:GTPase ObgE [Candidatus Moranbacteria bacterium]